MTKHRIARRWRKSFWRWHRRIGLACFLFLALLAATGILLNHADSWNLYAKPLPGSVARALYGDLFIQETYLYEFEEIAIYRIDQSIYLHELQLELDCSQQITGITLLQNHIWISCGENLSLFDSNEGALIEKIHLTGGDILGLARCAEVVCLRQQEKWQAFEGMSLVLSDLPVGTVVSEQLPNLVQDLPRSISHQPAELNFGRLIADIHSGSVLGQTGRLLVDLVGLAILFLSISGCYLWLGNKPR